MSLSVCLPCMDCGLCDDEECASVSDLADNNPKTAVGQHKPQHAYVPPVTYVHLADAMMDGAKKYGPYNWREVKISSTVYISAAKRHMDLWFDGEECASDSGVHHLGHAMACLALLLDAQQFGSLNDDRPPTSNLAEVVEAISQRRLNESTD